MPLATLNDKLNFGLIGVTASAVVWMFTQFASASEVEAIAVDVAYGQYYDRLDDYDEAISEGNTALADEYARQMERLKAKICEADPEWERCDNQG